ncbi:MAG TPA: DUF2760 domain-containing protein [Planctomycetota bacterium]|nr:DUF2760 domain-containing protein [Planctomycetota bacterium]
MHRLYIALLCFFRILFGRALPVEQLPDWALPLPPPPVQLPISFGATPGAMPRSMIPKRDESKAAAATAAPTPAPTPAPAPAPPPAPKVDDEKVREQGALSVLSLLQREGRLLDFLMEKIDGYQDAQIGAAVRAIHAGCKKAIAEHVELEPVLKGEEESPVTVPQDFDTRAIRLTGNVKGQPPFKGTLKHHGWRAKPRKPLAGSNGDATVVAPAEVEL